MLSLYLIEVSGRERGTLAGDDDDCVAPDDCGGTQRDKREERVLVRAGHSNDTHWLVDTHRAPVECGFLGGGGSGSKDKQTEDLSLQLPPHLYSSSILVSICSPVEQPLNGQVNLTLAVIKPTTCRETRQRGRKGGR